MKSVLILLCAVVGLFLTGEADAQTVSAGKLFPSEQAMRTALAGEDDDSVGGVRKDVLVLLPTVPVTFNALEKDSTGDWRMGAAMTAGVGATLLLGKAAVTGSNATLQPWVIAGAAINAGLKETEDRKVAEALTLSGFFGFGDVAVNFARGLLDGETTIGLSLKVDVLTNLAPDAYMCLRGCRD
ncbi:MAG TPA: hypothetical protein VFQ76_04720 [Longimicrobiaceae bacterium]|nr:hypothetical protein [Longimicrobiaceae bacterium]